MRLSGKEVIFRVNVVRHIPLPIQIRGGGMSFMLSADEAIELASHLADAVEQLNAPQLGRTAP
ncbi:hypothetical protein BH09ACT7_BH09ACT7_32410 [soil metagenome]